MTYNIIKGENFFIIGLLLFVISSVNAVKVAQWKLDGNLTDSLGNGRASINKAAWTEGRNNRPKTALSISTNNQILTIAPEHKWKINNYLTLSFWIKINKISSVVGILEQPEGLVVRSSGKVLMLFHKNRSSKKWDCLAKTSQKLLPNHWLHFTLVLDNGTASIYLNGKKSLKLAKYTEQYRFEKPMKIGTAFKNLLNGAICDINIYNNALTSKQIINIYQKNKPLASTYYSQQSPARLNLLVLHKDGDVKVDGNINEPVWRKVPWQTGFTNFKTGNKAKDKTKFKVIRDKTGLYFAVVASGGCPVATIKRNNGQSASIFNDDVIELFFNPDFNREARRKQCVFNANGAKAEYTFTADFKSERVAEWLVKTKINNSDYSAELFFPYSSLGINKEKIIGFNICRESKINNRKKRDITSWAGVKDNFISNYLNYGKLVLSNCLQQKKVNFNLLIDKKNITVNNDSGVSLSAILHYRDGSSKWLELYKKTFQFSPGKNIVSISSLGENIAGKSFFTVYDKNKSGQITAIGTIPFTINGGTQVRKLSYRQPILIPEVKKANYRNKKFSYQKLNNIIYFSSNNGYESKTCQKIQLHLKKYGVNIKQITKGDSNFNLKPYTLVIGSLRNSAFVKFLKEHDPKLYDKLNSIKVMAEGYVLKLDEVKQLAILGGQDGAGSYYAFRTLLQLIGFDPDKVPETTIVDWPDQSRRAVLETMTRFTHIKIDDFKRHLFKNIAGNKYNTCFISGIGHLDVDCDDKFDGRKFSNRQSMRELIEYARENFITCLPFFNSHGHSRYIVAAHPELANFPAEDNVVKLHGKSVTINPDLSEYYKIILPYFKEIYLMFKKPYAVHIGHDEILGYQPKTEVARRRISNRMIQEINCLYKFWKTLGVKDVIMWSDMILKNFNGGKPHNWYKIRDKLPRDLIMMHWVSYHARGKALREFNSLPFRKILSFNCPEYNHLLKEVKLSKYFALCRNRFSGGTPQFIFPDLLTSGKSDAKVLSYNYMVMAKDANLFWNNSKRISLKDFINQFGTGIMRYVSGSVTGSVAAYIPVALPNTTDTLAKWKLPDGALDFNSIMNSFNKSRFYSLINGKKHYSGMLLSHKQATVHIPFNSKCRAFAILHSATIRKPGKTNFIKKLQRTAWGSLSIKERTLDNFYGPEVAKYTINYIDGTFYSESIKLGYNIYLWNGSEVTSLPYALCGVSEIWDSCEEDNPASAQIFVMDNPFPGKIVRDITLEKNKPQVEIAVLAVGVTK